MSRIDTPYNSLSYHLRGAFRGYEIALGRYLKRYDLPMSQFYILRLQWLANGNTQKELAKRAFMSESVAAQVIKKMEEQGIVRRKPNPQDNRSQLVFLTPAGKALREEIVKDGIQVSGNYAPKLSREDLKTTIEVLAKVKAGFDDFNKL